jgi:hypothetical protein
MLQDTEIAITKVRPFPDGLKMFTPVEATAEKYGSAPRVFVFALKDKAFIPASQTHAVKVNPPDDVFAINSDHSMFFSAVDDTVNILLNAATKYDP